jgi:hypothetical protein
MKNQLKKIFILSLLILTGSHISTSLAVVTPEWNKNALTEEQLSQLLSGFRTIYDIGLPAISVPTLAKIIVPDDGTECCLVTNKQDNSIVPSATVGQYVKTPIVYTFETLPVGEQAKALNDSNPSNYAEFAVSGVGTSKATIIIKTDRPVTANALLVTLDQYVPTPATIELRATINVEDSIVVSERPLGGSISPSITFPKTTAKEWRVSFSHTQPLRITSIKLEEASQGTYQNTVRFLAQPNQSYLLYNSFDINRERIFRGYGYQETSPLEGGTPLIEGVLANNISNPKFIEGDRDGDGLIDAKDNCPTVANKDQEDLNNNKIGDACEDFDQDGYMNSQDNCPSVSNRNQLDTDNDKIGDACDKEESRLTEQYPWIPWLGIGFAGIVILFLFILTARKNISPDNSPK